MCFHFDSNDGIKLWQIVQHRVVFSYHHKKCEVCTLKTFLNKFCTDLWNLFEQVTFFVISGAGCSSRSCSTDALKLSGNRMNADLSHM